MENSILNALVDLSSQLLGNFFFYSLMGALISIFASIAVIKFCKRRGLLERSNKLWAFLSKSAYVLLPVSFLAIGITQGGIYGLHTTAEEWVTATTDPIIDYAEKYIPELQSYVNAHFPNPKGVSIEQAIIAHEKSQGDLTGAVNRTFKENLIGGLLDVATPYDGAISEPLVVLSEIDIHQIKRRDFQLLPASINAVTSIFFATYYWMFFAPFGMYFLVVLADIFLAKMLRITKRTEEVNRQDMPQWDFV